VATSLQTRVTRLEEATDGGGKCPRCSGTTVIYLNDKLDSVSKNGRILTPEEAQAFKAEEEDGRCPLCGTERGPEIVSGGATTCCPARSERSKTMTTNLQTRVRRLEGAIGGDGGGCERCTGVLIVVSNAISGEFHSASWKGEDISEDELYERRTETKCPRCGRKLDPENNPVIRVGGRR
jgi:hypothetical protein